MSGALELTCKYCNYKWEISKYNLVGHRRCPKCNDPNITSKDTDETKLDTYKGCKPFPQSNKKAFEPWGTD
jgi:hypothetical protein